ncbi:efflux RND transporter permease subunit [Bryobacter aggregatus]|uniref:efflux RND transporter permease subunit n=1 Tax=Bryobacter aggregatus TaxID=360054 RepID=UPI0004E1EC71|nr:efflux RND transporter permease subunit [Bryobacter aggregatus]
MSRFAIKTPYFIVVICLIIALVGGVSLSRMPVDMFPPINIPVVVVATFYSGMPPEQIESNITFHMERFLTLGSGIEHMESRSLTGVSVIKVYFQPGTNADAAVSTIANLAMAEMSRLPPGTLPPVVLKFDAASLPVCLVTLKGDGLSETQLKDIAQNNIRNQLAGVPGASVPQPFGGRTRQIMLYADPFKLEAHQLSLMDVVRSIGESNIILPAGDVQMGRLDYSIYTNSLLNSVADINQVPLKVVGGSPVRVSDIGEAKDAYSLQYNAVRVNGQRSVYLPVLKQGGDSNTIEVVDGVRKKIEKLVDTPDSLVSKVVFDQSQFVKTAIETLLHEGALGLFLTSVMILVFLGSMRATLAVFFSIPLSALATFVVLQIGGSSINTMVLGGLALALSRLIDNSVVVLENIYRHLEMGDPPAVAAEQGGREVALPVLAATLTTVVVFFPVTMLYGVSKFLFSSLALAVVISLFASYAVAMTVVPLFCARFIHSAAHAEAELGKRLGYGARFNQWFNRIFDRFLNVYDRMVSQVVLRPVATLVLFSICFGVSLLIFPLLGLSFFPQTDAGQFVMRVKAPSGTRLVETEADISKLEDLIRRVVAKDDLNMIVSNIGIDPGFSAMYSNNAAMHTAFVQVALNEGHRTGSYEYIERVKHAMQQELPQLTPYFASGSLVESVVNMGLPAPVNLQVAGSNLAANYSIAQELAQGIRKFPGVADVFIPQDLDQPALKIDIDRVRSRELGLSQKEVVTNVITALTSNQMIAPSIWVDPKNGNNYFLSVQYPEQQVKNVIDLRAISLRGANSSQPTRLDMVSNVKQVEAPTEVDHYQIRRVIDVYVRPSGEDLGDIAGRIDGLIAKTKLPKGVDVSMRGMVEGMRASFRSFAIGLVLSVLLLYLILVAQFRSFLDPFIILLALPPGISGVLLTLWLSDTTLNVMSLMGVVMLAGVAMSNSILIVEFAHHLRHEGRKVRDAIVTACRVRLRPVLMTSLATIIGLMPMALKLGEGSESYAPLARALLGGLTVSVLCTVFLVPAGFYLAYRNQDPIEE